MKICGIDVTNFELTQIHHQLEEVCGREWVKVLLKHYTTSTTINTLVHKMVNGKSQ